MNLTSRPVRRRPGGDRETVVVSEVGWLYATGGLAVAAELALDTYT